MPVSDIENTHLAVVGLHRDQASKSLSSKTASGDVVRRKPLGVVNFQNVNTNACLPSKQCIPPQKDLQGAMTVKLTKNNQVQRNGEKSKSSGGHGHVMIGSRTKEALNYILEDDVLLDKEAMIIGSEDIEDDYRDLWPVREQPTTYLKHIEAWRPPVSAGCIPIPPISPPSFSEMDFDSVAAADPLVDFNALSTSLPPFDEEDLEYLSCLT